MNTSQSPASPLPPLMLVPLAQWYAGFDYAYGFQLKLLLDFWGLSDRGR